MRKRPFDAPASDFLQGPRKCGRRRILNYSICAILLGIGAAGEARAVSRSILYSEQYGVEVFALSDGQGEWCGEQVNLQAVVKPKSPLLPNGLPGFMGQLGPLLAKECPQARRARVQGLSAGSREPIGEPFMIASQGDAAASAKPVAAVQHEPAVAPKPAEPVAAATAPASSNPDSPLPAPAAAPEQTQPIRPPAPDAAVAGSAAASGAAPIAPAAAGNTAAAAPGNPPAAADGTTAPGVSAGAPGQPAADTSREPSAPAVQGPVVSPEPRGASAAAAESRTASSGAAGDAVTDPGGARPAPEGVASASAPAPGGPGDGSAARGAPEGGQVKPPDSVPAPAPGATPPAATPPPATGTAPAAPTRSTPPPAAGAAPAGSAAPSAIGTGALAPYVAKLRGGSPDALPHLDPGDPPLRLATDMRLTARGSSFGLGLRPARQFKLGSELLRFDNGEEFEGLTPPSGIAEAAGGGRVVLYVRPTGLVEDPLLGRYVMSHIERVEVEAGSGPAARSWVVESRRQPRPFNPLADRRRAADFTVLGLRTGMDPAEAAALIGKTVGGHPALDEQTRSLVAPERECRIAWDAAPGSRCVTAEVSAESGAPRLRRVIVREAIRRDALPQYIAQLRDRYGDPVLATEVHLRVDGVGAIEHQLLEWGAATSADRHGLDLEQVRLCQQTDGSCRLPAFALEADLAIPENGDLVHVTLALIDGAPR